MLVKLNMNCEYGVKGQEVNIPDDILKLYPEHWYEKKEVKKGENKAILSPKSTKSIK